MIEEILKGLDVNREEVRIYLELLESGASTAGNLAKKLGMARATLYGMLQRLHDKGVIYKSLKHGVRTFRAEPPEKLSQLFDKKIENLQLQKTQFKNIIPDLNSRISNEFLSPRFEFFEGLESVKYAMQDFLSYQDMESFNFWCAKDMVDLLSQDHFFYSSRKRMENNIWQKLLVPYDPDFSVRKYPSCAGGEFFKRELRVAPPFINSTMSYWVYKDKVLYFSSRSEAYAYIIESIDMAEMMRNHFMAVWKLSKKYEMEEDEADEFKKFVIEGKSKE